MKKIFIGVDVSKEKCDATAIYAEKGLTEVKKLDYFVFENRPKGFSSLLSWAKKLKADVSLESILFVCETTGAYDRALCDYIYSKDWISGVRALFKYSGAVVCVEAKMTRQTR